MGSMLGNTSKLLVDQKSGGNNVFYLPLDKMMERAAEMGASPAQRSTGALPDDSRSPASIRGRSSLRTGRGE
jgi:membrane protease subunit HflK